MLPSLHGSNAEYTNSNCIKVQAAIVYKILIRDPGFYSNCTYIRMLYIATLCCATSVVSSSMIGMYVPYLLSCQDHIICASTYILLHGMWTIGHYNIIIMDVLLL